MSGGHWLFRFLLADAGHICGLLFQDLQPLLGTAGELCSSSLTAARAGHHARHRPRPARLQLAGARGYRGQSQAEAGPAHSSPALRLERKYEKHWEAGQIYLEGGGLYLRSRAPAWGTFTFLLLSFPLVFPTGTSDLLSTQTFPPEQLIMSATAGKTCQVCLTCWNIYRSSRSVWGRRPPRCWLEGCGSPGGRDSDRSCTPSACCRSPEWTSCRHSRNSRTGPPGSSRGQRSPPRCLPHWRAVWGTACGCWWTETASPAGLSSGRRVGRWARRDLSSVCPAPSSSPSQVSRWRQTAPLQFLLSKPVSSRRMQDTTFTCSWFTRVGWSSAETLL